MNLFHLKFFRQTRTAFDRILVINDSEPRTAAMNMAMDEALLESTEISAIRFYRWNSPALSFGYFGKFADVSSYATQRDLVRRWTGGGVVFHGNDLTYSIVIPASDPVFKESAMSIYEKIHRALCDALVALGQRAVVLDVARRSLHIGHQLPSTAVSPESFRRGYNGHCFADPVHADLLVDGRKIAGAAQRRTRRGLLQQGSIQGIDLSEDFGARFTRELSGKCAERKVDHETLRRAREIATRKYGTKEWLRRW
jgi:lipoate-protein ligase A